MIHVAFGLVQLSLGFSSASPQAAVAIGAGSVPCSTLRFCFMLGGIPESRPVLPDVPVLVCVSQKDAPAAAAAKAAEVAALKVCEAAGL